MTDLTEDEVTVLMIAAEGESMMPIGRWAAPVESLIRKGYLSRTSKFNNYITDEGRKAVETHDTAHVKAVLEATNQIAGAHTRMVSRAAEIAALLAELAMFSAAVTGKDRLSELKHWARVILEDAKERVK